MFVLSQQESVAYRAIAMLVSVALVLWAVGSHLTAQAANLTSVSNTLTDSDPGALSGHTIAFTIPAGSSLAGADDIVINFDAAFVDVTNTVIGDITATVDGAPVTEANFVSDATSITFDGATAAAGAEVVIVIADDVITNPAAGSYEFFITTQGGDTGRTRVAIVDNVDVTARVDTTFDFTVSGFAAAGIDANGTSTTGTTTSTALPFGTLTAGSIETLAQRLNVTTNAIGGYVVTVEQDQNLLSSTGADIDGFIDGAYTNTPTAWQSPTNNISDENTWGHWALTSSDGDLNGDEFGSDLWVAASTTPRQVMSHNGPSDGTTVNVGSTTVGYQIEITPLQEAADDYNTVLTYIATPTF